MTTRTQSDRQFAKAVGIQQECQMCDLLHIDIQRQKDTTIDREVRILFLIRLMSQHKREVNMWKLAAFAGLMGTILMSYVSLR